MGRPSRRVERRAEIARAFAAVLAEQGPGGTSIAAVAARAGCAPGLLHHHFADKADLYQGLLDELGSRFRGRVEALGAPSLESYGDAALALGQRSDVVAARAWVGLFAEALGDRALGERLRRLLDGEIDRLERLSGGTLGRADATAVLAYIVGALVLGTLTPRKSPGFAAAGLRKLLKGMR